MNFKNRFLFLSLGGISCLLAFLMLTQNQERSHTILAVDTIAVAANPSEFLNKSIRLRGFVKPATVLRFADQAAFQIEQEGQSISVFFTGKTALPDTFTDGAAIRAEGFLRSSDGVFEASAIEAKCASKYSVKGDTSYDINDENDIYDIYDINDENDIYDINDENRKEEEILRRKDVKKDEQDRGFPREAI